MLQDKSDLDLPLEVVPIPNSVIMPGINHQSANGLWTQVLFCHVTNINMNSMQLGTLK